MSVLSSIVAASTRPPQPFVLLQSSAVQSALPILQQLIANAKGTVLLLSFLYPPIVFARHTTQRKIDIVDCTAHVPHYHDDSDDWKQNVLVSLEKQGEHTFMCLKNFEGRWLNALSVDSSLPLTVVIDSLETLLSNTSGSISSVYALLSEVFATVQTHRGLSILTTTCVYI